MSFTFIKNGRGFVTKKQETIVSAAVIIMVTTLIIKFLGLLKLTLLAHTFGTSRELDIFFAASTIPNILFNIFVIGSLNTALIPVLSEVFEKEGSKKLSEVFNSFLNISAFLLIITGIIGIIEARYISELAVSLYHTSSQAHFTFNDRDLLTQMLRIMFLSPMILGVSFLMSGVLQVYKRFLITQLASVLYTLGVIAGILVFVPFMGVIGLAWGVVFGSFMHLIIQYPILKHLGVKYSLGINFKDIYVKKITKLMIPRVIGLGGEQIALLVDTILALGLSEGSLTVFNYAYALMMFPVSFIGWSFAQAAFATLSEEFAKKNDSSFRNIFIKSFQQISFLVLPLMVIFIILRVPIVRIVYGVGQNSQFGWDSTQVTAWALLFFGIGILSQSLLGLVIRAFYAIHDTITPLKVSLVSLAINIFLSIYLIQVFGRLDTNIPFFQNIMTIKFSNWNTSIGWQAVGGLALATTIAISINLIALLVILNKKMNICSYKEFWSPFIKKGVSAFGMGLVMYIMFKSIDHFIDTTKTLEELFLLVGVSLMGLIVYLSLEYMFEDSDINVVYKMYKYITSLIKHIPPENMLPQVVAVQDSNSTVNPQEQG